MPDAPDDRLRSDLESLRIQSQARSRKKRNPSARPWIAGGIAIALLLVAAFWWLGPEPPPVQVGYARVTSQDENTGVSLLSGAGYVVTGDRYVSVGARIPGRIEEYFVEEGQTVTAGNPLVRLDDRDYRAALRSVEASVAVARANLALAQAELRRGESLRSDKIISDQEFDIQKNKAAVSRATLSQLEAQLDQARINLEYTTLRAPSDGVVLAKLKEVGEIAVPGGFAGSGDLIRLANLSDLRAELDVNEADLNQIELGGPARVVPDAYPDVTYGAEVVKLYPQVNRQKGTLRVEVRILEPDDRLLPDMSARVTFLSPPPADQSGNETTIWIPAAAVQGPSGEPFVWIVEQGRTRRAPVRIAERAQDRMRIAEGLRGGEALILNPEDVSEGQAVTVREES